MVEGQERVWARLRELVRTGAELEQRYLDGTPVAYTAEGADDCVWALADDVFWSEVDPDEPSVVWLCPLLVDRTFELDDGGIGFDSCMHFAWPLTVQGLELLAEGHVLVRHLAGTYSVVRPVSSAGRRQLVDAWAARRRPRVRRHVTAASHPE